MRPLTKQEIIQRLRSQHAALRVLGVRRMGLFGSFVRDEPTDQSDVDILVEFEPGHKTFDNFIRVAFLLEEVLERPVDLLTLEGLSPYIAPHVLREVEDVPLGA